MQPVQLKPSQFPKTKVISALVDVYVELLDEVLQINPFLVSLTHIIC